MEDWKQTFTGKKFYLENPRVEDVCIEDIAHALSMICRFGGHVKKFYSVAEHCVHASIIAKDPPLNFFALLHDAPEAYSGDIASPIKRVFPEIKGFENRIAEAVNKRFGLVWHPEIHRQIKEIDTRLLITERNQIMSESPEPWFCDIAGIEPYDFKLSLYSPKEAEEAFLGLFGLFNPLNR